MADRFILSHIRRQPLFARLLPEQAALVADAVQALRYEAGEIVFRQGQIGDGLLLFVSGRAVLTQATPDGKEVTVGTVSAGEYVNQAALFNEVTTTATLRVVETAIVLFLARQRLAAILAQHPDIRSSLQPAGVPLAGSSEPRAFQSQRQGEKVLAAFRAHWWAFASRLWLPFVVATLLFILSALAGAIPLVSGLLFMLGLGVPGLLVIYLFAEWRNDKVVITDQRVTRVRRTLHNWSTVISEIPISAIHEVNVSIPPTDPFAQMFDYGNVIVKTSGDTLNLVLDHVPNPKAVQNVIFTNRHRYQESVAQQNREAMRNELDTFLGRTPARPAAPTAAPSPPAAAPRVGFLQMKFVNEKGETVYRKHYLVWLSHILLPSLVILGGLIVLVIAAFQTFGGNPGGLGLAGFALGFLVTLIGAGALFLADWDWRNDMYIVGNQTISLIHKRPLWLQNQHDQILLSQVDNVISDMRGFLHTLVKMGDVRLLLTGTEVQNAKVFRNVHRPQEIQQELSERRRRAQQQQQEQDAQRQRQAILDYLAVYHESLKDVANDANVPGTASPSAPPAPPPAQSPPVYDRSRPPNVPRIRPDDH